MEMKPCRSESLLYLVNKRSSSPTFIVCPTTREPLIFSNKPFFLSFFLFAYIFLALAHTTLTDATVKDLSTQSIVCAGCSVLSFLWVRRTPCQSLSNRSDRFSNQSPPTALLEGGKKRKGKREMMLLIAAAFPAELGRLAARKRRAMLHVEALHRSHVSSGSPHTRTHTQEKNYCCTSSIRTGVQIACSVHVDPERLLPPFPLRLPLVLLMCRSYKHPARGPASKLNKAL